MLCTRAGLGPREEVLGQVQPSTPPPGRLPAAEVTLWNCHVGSLPWSKKCLTALQDPPGARSPLVCSPLRSLSSSLGPCGSFDPALPRPPPGPCRAAFFLEDPTARKTPGPLSGKKGFRSPRNPPISVSYSRVIILCVCRTSCAGLEAPGGFPRPKDRWDSAGL